MALGSVPEGWLTHGQPHGGFGEVWQALPKAAEWAREDNRNVSSADFRLTKQGRGNLMMELFLPRTPIHQPGSGSCDVCCAVAHSFFPLLNAGSVALLSRGNTRHGFIEMARSQGAGVPTRESSWGGTITGKEENVS